MKGLVIHKVWNVFVFFPLLAAAEDNISWESVENGTKRWGTKETCQICEPRQTGYRLIPSRPWKWRKRKKKCKKRGIARAATASDAWFQTSLYISVGPTWLHSASNHPFPQTNQTERGRVMPSSLTLWSDARRFPAIIGSYWSHWSGRSPHLGPRDPRGVSFHSSSLIGSIGAPLPEKNK